MSDPSEYTPPKVWTWNKANGGRFANINRPVSGPTHEKDLPVGRHPLQLYSLATPNGVKVTVMLEELLALGHRGAEYDAWLIRIGEGDQFGSGFVAINPNSKIPALLDRSGPTPIRVFESGAILMHLAEKFGAFLPTEAAARAECLSWLFWQMGSAPYLGGGFGHFYAYAPTKMEYPIDRFAMEVKRQLDVLDRRLADHAYVAGSDYTIADIAIWPWYGGLVKGWLYGAAEFLQVQDYRHVQRWADMIGARPAVQRGRMVNRVTGEPESQLHERHDARDFETRTQDKLARGTCQADGRAAGAVALARCVAHPRALGAGVLSMADTLVFPGTVEWSGENPGISLKEAPDGPFTTLASFFRVVLSPHGRGHALVLLLSPQELAPPPERANVCYTDNEPLARWLVSDYVSHFGAWRGLPGLQGLAYRSLDSVTSAGDALTRYSETIRSGETTVELHWSGLGKPFCFALAPAQSATGQHHMPSLFVGCESATVSVNGRARPGAPVPREIAGHRISTAMLAFSETWLRV